MSQSAVLEKQPWSGLISLNNILFTTDFSASSLAALPLAAAVARRYGSRIYIAHAVEPHPYPLVSGETITFLDELVQAAQKEINGLAGSGLLKGIEHQALLGQGEITLVLKKFIQEHHIDLVITGTHGRRGFRRFFLGSVAEEIFRTSPCPVLTVGPHVSHQAPESLSLHQVLYPTCLGRETSSAARYALSFALEYGARLTMLHVMNTAVPGPAWQSAKSCYDQMQAQIPTEVKAWCEVDCQVETGDRAEIILKVAGERKADLIVLGVKRASALATHRMGNLAYRVVTEAACPVLTTRGDSDHEGGGKRNP
ncbi:MAG TPA: universal stress protein [Terriglobia bacterium]|nr:universal stress protein [Terriglobia bacterium]